MPHETAVSRALRELRNHISQEEDANQLGHLLRDLNSLLDLIEKQLEKLDSDNLPDAK
jgi:hypothetical protein